MDIRLLVLAFFPVSNRAQHAAVMGKRTSHLHQVKVVQTTRL